MVTPESNRYTAATYYPSERCLEMSIGFDAPGNRFEIAYLPFRRNLALL